MSMRLIYAEWLKLFKRRGLFWGSLISTVGGLIVVFIIVESLHLANPTRYGPVGGANLFGSWMTGLSLIGAVVAIIMGATAGTADVSSGVFRDLVATGCPRWKLFSARVPGSLALLIPIVTLGYIVIALISVFFTGPKPAPELSLLVQGYGWVLLFTGFDLVVTLGFASLIGSRAAAIGILLGWQFIASPLLQQVSFLGSARRALFTGALGRLNPVPSQGALETWGVTYTVAGAAFILIAWAVVMLAAGWWRTTTRDA
jgi:ABC-type transport system involved in multi-copper enzyme maturation permease subunit